MLFRHERPDGGTGRRGGLKIRLLKGSGGSIPPLGRLIKKIKVDVVFIIFFCIESNVISAYFYQYFEKLKN